MDEQELRKIISEVLHENPRVMYIPDLAPYLLEKLDKAGYRKIPEGAVVLSKEEYDELLMDWDKKEQDIKKSINKDVLDSIQQAYNDGRKETAKAVLEEMNENLIRLFPINSIGHTAIYESLSNIAMEYGVEVEE